MLTILCILFIVFNVVVFSTHLPKTSAFWAADWFALIAIAAQGVTHYLAYGNAETLMSKVYGFPVVQVGYYYLGIQLIISLSFIITASWVPTWVVISICVILLGAAIIGIIINDNARDVIEEMDDYHNSQTAFMKDLFTRVKTLADNSQDHELKKALKSFADEIEYSDFVSGPDIASIEHRLWNAVADLEKSIYTDEISTSINKIYCAENLLQQRNNLCQRYKKRTVNQGTPSDF